MSIYNKNYKIVNPGTYGHDGKPSLFSEDTSGKRRHFVRYATKLNDLISFDPVYGRSGYSLDNLGYLTIWGDHMYYRNNRVLPGKYSPLTGFQLETGRWIDYSKMSENIRYDGNNYMFTAPYMFDTIYKWDNDKQYGDDSKLIYKGNSLENYFKPYNAKITTNIDENRSLKDTIFKDRTISPFGDVTVINSLGSYFGGNGAVKYSNGYSWNLPMPLKLSISANTVEQRWMMRLTEDKKYIKTINLAYFPFIMIEGAMRFYADGTMSIKQGTMLYHRKTKKLLALNGHTYKNKPFSIVPDQKFDMAFLFHSFSYDDNGKRVNTVYNYLDYTVKAKMAGKDGEFDLNVENGKGFLPVDKGFHVAYGKGTTGQEQHSVFVEESNFHQALSGDMSKLYYVEVQYEKIPGLFYTNTTYDITREPTYLPWRKAKNVPGHVTYEDKNTLPLVVPNIALTLNGNIGLNYRMAWHENSHPFFLLFNVTTNYLRLTNLDCYLKQEPGIYGSGYTTHGGNLVGGLKDTKVTLGYYSDVSEANRTKYNLPNIYSVRRRGDELNSDMTYLQDHRGDIPFYTEEAYKADIMKGIGLQQNSSPDSYLPYLNYVRNNSAGFNDFNPIIPGKGGVIRAATNGEKKATVSGDVLVYEKSSDTFYKLKEGAEIDIVELPDGRNYYNVNNLSGKTANKITNIHPRLSKLLKRHMVPLKALNNTDPPKPRSYLGDYLSKQDFSTYIWDNSSLRSIAVDDMFVTAVQYLEWVPKRFPFEMKDATQVLIRANHPFKVVQQNSEMIIQTKKDILTSFPINLRDLYDDKDNVEFLDTMPTYDDSEIDNRYFEDLSRDGKAFWVYDHWRWIMYGLLPSNRLPERVSFAATEILNFPSIKSLGIDTKDKLTSIGKLRWNNDYPGYYSEFPGGNVMVSKGTKRGWYHYYGTTDRDNQNRSDDVYTYLFSEPIPQREVVPITKTVLTWNDNNLWHNMYNRGPRYNDKLDNLEDTLIDVKFKDIYYTVGGNQNGGMINSKRRYKVVAAFGVGDHLNDEVINTHYWGHSLNLTDDAYDNKHVSDNVERYCVNSSSSDRKEYTGSELYIGVDNKITYSFGSYGTLNNSWIYFEVDDEIIYQANIKDLYTNDYYRDLNKVTSVIMPNSKGIYFLARRKMPSFDLDGKKVIFANYCFTKGEYNTFIKDSPLFYYEEEAKTGKYVIPEKYKAIQAKLDRGVPLKVYMHFHPNKDYWKDPTPVLGVNPYPFNGHQVFDFTKPPKLIGETKYINTTCDFGFNDTNGIVITLDNSMNAVNNPVFRQYELNVSVTIFDISKDTYVVTAIKTKDYLDSSTFVKKDNKLFTNKIILKSFKTKITDAVESIFNSDLTYPKLSNTTTRITSTEYDNLKSKKNPKIMKVEVNVKPKYYNTYTRDFKSTYEFDHTYYFKEYDLVSE